MAATVGVVALLFGATGVFAELQSALDRIWRVPEAKKPKGIWGLLRARLLCMGLILGLVFLMMVSLAVSAASAAFGGWTSGMFPGAGALLEVANFCASLAILTALFALIYKLMPTARIAWRDVWVGALVTAALFDVGRLGIGLYLGRSDLTETFQAAGSMVALLVWVYYAAQVFLLGAEFTRAHAEMGARASPLSAVREEAASGTQTAPPPAPVPAAPAPQPAPPAAGAVPGAVAGAEPHPKPSASPRRAGLSPAVEVLERTRAEAMSPEVQREGRAKIKRCAIRAALSGAVTIGIAVAARILARRK